MIAALGLGLVGLALWQGVPGPDANEGGSAPGAAAAPAPAAAPPATAQQPTEEIAPTFLRRFADLAGGHSRKVACSSDGRLIAIANGNPTVTIETNTTTSVGDWKPSVDLLDAETGKTTFSLPLTTDEEDAVLAATQRVSHVEASALAFSPDGNVVAVGTSIGQVKLFDARTGELLRSLDDEEAKLADAETPAEWKTLRRAMGSVASLAFSPDGSSLAACGGAFADFAEGFSRVSRMGFRRTGPGRLKMWEVETGTLQHDLVGHNDQAYAVAFSPDGNLLASAGRWNEEIDRFGNGVLIWNARTGEQIHRLIRTNADAGARAIAFSPDSKLLAMGTQRFGDDEPEMPSTGGVSLIHVMSGVEEWLVTVPGWAKPLAFSSDGRSLAVLCGGRSIRFLDVRTGAMKHEIQPDGSQQDVSWDDFALAPQGGLLAIGEVEKQKGSVAVWSTRAPGQSNADASEPIKNFTTEVRVSTIACSGDGTLLAVANGSPTLTLQQDGSSRPDGAWKPLVDVLDAATGKRFASLTLTTAEEDAALAATERVTHLEVTALALSPDGGLVAVGTSIGQIKLFNARTGELVCSLDDEAAKLAVEETPENWKTLRRAMGSVASLEFSPDGALLAACGHSFADFAPVFDGVGRLGEQATGPGRLKVWEVGTWALKHDLAGHSHAHAVAFSPDGSLLASAGQWLTDREAGAGAILWNPQDGTQERTISTEANGGAHAVAFSPDGALLVIHARRFDLDKANDTGASVISLAHVSSGVEEWQRTIANLAKPLGFFEGDHSVLVLNGGRSLQFLDSDNGETLALISRAAVPHEVGRWNAIAIGRTGGFLAIGGVDDEGKGHVQVWNID